MDRRLGRAKWSIIYIGVCLPSKSEPEGVIWTTQLLVMRGQGLQGVMYLAKNECQTPNEKVDNRIFECMLSKYASKAWHEDKVKFIISIYLHLNWHVGILS